MPEAFIEVASEQALAEVVELAHQEGIIAVDTEFQRTRTYHPIAGLYQLKVKQHCYLVDPLAIDDLSLLKELMDRADVMKIMHACQEDMTLFAHHLKIWPDAIFDTQIAAAFAGYSHQIGYKGLVAEVIGVELSKSVRTSNWLQRPLSDEQKHYAAEDVEYLPQLHDHLSTALKRLGRFDWYRDELKRLYATDRAYAPLQWHNYERSWSLKGVATLRFQALWDWREEAVKQRDIPRQWLAKDKALHELARTELPYDEIFKKHCIKSPYLISRMRNILAKTDSSTTSEWPDRSPRPLELDEKDLLIDLQKQAKACAANHDLSPGLLVTKKMLNKLVHCYRQHLPLPDWWQGWRGEVLGENYLSRISG